MLSPRDWAGFVRELGSRFGPQMVRNHARVDEQSAIGSVWPNMRPIPEVATMAEFAAWASARHAAV